MTDDKTYNRIFVGNNDGKEILEELKKRHVDGASYVQGDTHQTAFNEGARAVVALIIKKSERREE